MLLRVGKHDRVSGFCRIYESILSQCETPALFVLLVGVFQRYHVSRPANIPRRFVRHEQTNKRRPSGPRAVARPGPTLLLCPNPFSIPITVRGQTNAFIIV